MPTRTALDVTAAGEFDGLELEIKFRLADAAQADALRHAVHGVASASVEQINHFFDTAEHDLGRARYTLRLREELGHGFLLTAKGPERRSADGLLTAKVERQAALDPSGARALLAGTAAPLAVLGALLGAECELCVELERVTAGKAVRYL